MLPITPERSPAGILREHPVFSALVSSSFTRREKEERKEATTGAVRRLRSAVSRDLWRRLVEALI